MLGVLGLVLGGVVAIAVEPWAGVTFAGASLVALVGVFGYGSRGQRESRQKPE